MSNAIQTNRFTGGVLRNDRNERSNEEVLFHKVKLKYLFCNFSLNSDFLACFQGFNHLCSGIQFEFLCHHQFYSLDLIHLIRPNRMICVYLFRKINQRRFYFLFVKNRSDGEF